MRDVDKIVSIADAKLLAKRRTPKSIYSLFEGGSGPSITAGLNEKAFEEVLFRPPSAVYQSRHSLRTRVFGHEVATPLILSSVGALRVGHHGGEIAATRAAGAHGAIQFVSGVTTTAIEDIVAEATGPVYQQIYYIGGRDGTAAMIERARDAGAAGLVLIADSAATNSGAEVLYPQRSHIPTSVSPKEAARFLPQVWNRPRWLKNFLRHNGMKMPVAANTRGPNGRPLSFLDAVARNGEPTPCFDDIAWMRDIWDCPVIVKGVVTPESARKAVDYGASGIVVSNHGGNRLDGTIPTLRALPHVVDAVGSQVDVVLDGGVRRGTDVVKAMAMGAKAVGIGRAYIYGLLAAGEPGVRRVIEVLNAEMESAITSLGVASVEDLDPSLLEIPRHWATLTVDELLRAKSAGQAAD